MKKTRRPKADDLSHISEPLRKLSVPIGTLRPDPRNARRHPERNLAAIAESLKTFGQQDAVRQVPRLPRLRPGPRDRQGKPGKGDAQ